MATMLALVAIVAVSSYLAPQLSGRDIFFGVTVAPAFPATPQARAIARRYAAEVFLLAAAAAVFVATSPVPVVSAGILAAQSVGASFAFVRAWSAVRTHGVMP